MPSQCSYSTMALSVALLVWLTIVCACASGTNTSSHVPWRNFDKLRRSNCTKCAERLRMNVVNVLPRLTLIKHKILNAIGKNSNREQNGSKNRKANELPATDKSGPKSSASYRTKDIVSYPKIESKYCKITQ